jgi:hypothetical protein
LQGLHITLPDTAHCAQCRLRYSQSQSKGYIVLLVQPRRHLRVPPSNRASIGKRCRRRSHCVKLNLSRFLITKTAHKIPLHFDWHQEFCHIGGWQMLKQRSCCGITASLHLHVPVMRCRGFRGCGRQRPSIKSYDLLAYDGPCGASGHC